MQTTLQQLFQITVLCNCIINSTAKDTKCNELNGLSLDIEKQIYCFLRVGNSCKLTQILKELFARIKNAAIGINSARMILYDLLGIVIKTCKENNVELSTVFSNEITPQEILSSIHTIDESEDWIMSLFNKLLSVNSSDELKYNSEYVRKTIGFIKRNFAKNISLSDASDEIGIVNTYLSKLFKDEVGIGFAEYLGNYRIEKAKALLEAGSHGIKDIINLCGFGNYDYFIKFFRKKVGVTPNKYLKDHEL